MPRKKQTTQGTATTTLYVFLSTGKISSGDLERLIALTDSGLLRWYDCDGTYAFSARPTLRAALDDSEVSNVIIGRNLKGIRMGYNPDTKMWHYLRLQDHAGRYHYVEFNARGRVMLTDHDDQHHYLPAKESKQLVHFTNQVYARAVLQVAQELNVSEARGLVVNRNM